MSDNTQNTNERDSVDAFVQRLIAENARLIKQNAFYTRLAARIVRQAGGTVRIDDTITAMTPQYSEIVIDRDEAARKDIVRVSGD
jgi:hypothetical protein